MSGMKLCLKVNVRRHLTTGHLRKMIKGTVQAVKSPSGESVNVSLRFEKHLAVSWEQGSTYLYKVMSKHACSCRHHKCTHMHTAFDRGLFQLGYACIVPRSQSTKKVVHALLSCFHFYMSVFTTCSPCNQALELEL